MDSVDITFTQLLFAYIFVIILFIIMRVRKIPRQKLLLLSVLRMTLQLVLAGYLLGLAFSNGSLLLTVAIYAGMTIFACVTILQRTDKSMRRHMAKGVWVSVTIGATCVMIYFLAFVIGIDPWYDTRYFISISGMVLGNAMTGVTLSMNTFLTDFKQNRPKIETALMLGASPARAAKISVDNAFTSAILPTLTQMLGMGIVILPGMMTGQILAGASPDLAIKYQIGVMLAILGSVSLCVIIFLHYASREVMQHEYSGIGTKIKKNPKTQ